MNVIIVGSCWDVITFIWVIVTDLLLKVSDYFSFCGEPHKLAVECYSNSKLKGPILHNKFFYFRYSEGIFLLRLLHMFK